MMKQKLTTLLFGLLLAVGWTSNALAQDVVHSKAYYDALTYEWTDANGETHTSAATELATDPYQIYELLRFVYCDQRFPGPLYSAYTPLGQREDPVYYGAVAGGWDINASDVTAPTAENEGYTALIVALNNDNYVEPEESAYSNSGHFDSKTQVIEYFRKTMVSVKLLTDGLRIGKDEDFSRGTVFNCDGTYNKFFILSKGQARKKAPAVSSTPFYRGEEVPFKNMFEQFSPTSGESGSQITDFYSKMLEGSVYNVVHDCASVIQNKHQFSMSGNTGTNAYALSGLNFFIPDYRLKFWSTTSGSRTVDGRDMNPYYTVNTTTGQHNMNSTFGTLRDFAAWYAQYNQAYAPKMGIYKITLNADAEKVADYSENNRYYNVTLEWISSLNEMTGNEVTQTYTIYVVDEQGNQTALTAEGVTNPTGSTTVTYKVPQNEHSYTINYIVMGQPNDNEHPAFIAWSNQDDVTIPGWNDFLALSLDHYESDFVLHEEKNYYRNFLLVGNENEDNALTLASIRGTGDSPKMDQFNIYRYDYSKPAEQIKIGKLEFWDNHDNKSVGYGVAYENGTQEIYRPEGNATKYDLTTMGVPRQGDVRVKGNGDLIIYPSGYTVNFKSIRVYNGSTQLASWTAPNSTTGTSPLPSNMKLSPGSLWEPYTTDDGDRVYYIEGGGYIYVEDILNNPNYNDLRVEINAYGDGSSVAKISVNDESKTLANAPQTTPYTWNEFSLDITGHSYVKVTNASQLTSGAEYLIVYEGESVAFDGSRTTTTDLDDNYNTIPVTFVDGQIVATDATDASYFTITASGSNYTIRSASGRYIGRQARDNGISTSTTNAMPNEITFDDNGNVNIHYTYTTGIIFTTTYDWYLRYNATSGQKRFRYYGEGSQQPIQLYKRMNHIMEDGMIRLGHLPIVDQFTAETKDNTHPYRYGYVLKYEPEEGDAKRSGTVEVPVQKTGSTINGYYTQEQVDNDVDKELTANVMSADVTMNLGTDPDVFYYRLQAQKNANPADNGNFITELQRKTDGTYREMLTTSPMYVANDEFSYPAGTFDYFNEANPTIGQPGDFLTYVPTVTTWGIDRRYYETDHLDNTYGSPISKTGVGQANVTGATLERQAKNANGDWNGSVNWYDENGEPCSMYILTLTAEGVLPTTAKNVVYEPYMYRIWVVSDGLRNMNLVEGTGAVNDETADRTSPRLIYEEKTTETSIQITKSSDWAKNVMFGKLNDANAQFIIRFYYKVVPSTTSSGMMLDAGNRDETPMYYAAEGDFEPSPATAVYELVINGEVVGKTYINAIGQQSDKPFKGVNIVITRYSDGTVTTTKIVK